MADYPHHHRTNLPFRNFDLIGGQISDPIPFFNQTQFPYQSQFVRAMGSEADGGPNGWEPVIKRPKEEFLENSPVSSIDFFKMEPVSTGLGLSLDNGGRVASSSGASHSLFDDLFDLELQRIDAEMDSFIRNQSAQLSKSILEKFRAKQIQTLASFEETLRQKLREKELEVQNITKLNMNLEEETRRLSHQISAWQQQAKYNEEMITALRFKCQQLDPRVWANKNNREGCGDSEVVSLASCSKGATNFADNQTYRLACTVCGMRQVCMLLLPCRHLCLCKDCEANLSSCPLCQSAKFLGVEIFYM